MLGCAAGAAERMAWKLLQSCRRQGVGLAAFFTESPTLLPAGSFGKFADEGRGALLASLHLRDLYFLEQRRSLKLWERSESEQQRRKQSDRIVVYRGKWMRPFRLVVRCVQLLTLCTAVR